MAWGRDVAIEWMYPMFDLNDPWVRWRVCLAIVAIGAGVTTYMLGGPLIAIAATTAGAGRPRQVRGLEI